MIARRVLLSLPALAFPGHARAQPRRARVGLATPDASLALRDVFLRELDRLGWRAGRNLEILDANAEGDPARLPQVIAAMIAREPDVIVSSSNRTHIAVRDATGGIPVVAVAMVDPVLLGLSDRLSRPSRNFTGNIGFVEELMGKRVELLREVLPAARRIALLLDPGNPAFPATHAAAVATAERLGFEVMVAGFGTSAEVLPALDQARARGAEAVVVVPDALALPQMAAIARRAEAHGLPSIGFNESDLAQGVTFALGVDRALLWRGAAGMVDRLLRGARVADIPFERPTKVFVGINQGAAQRLGVTIPTSVFARADEVLE